MQTVCESDWFPTSLVLADLILANSLQIFQELTVFVLKLINTAARRGSMNQSKLL